MDAWSTVQKALMAAVGSGATQVLLPVYQVLARCTCVHGIALVLFLRSSASFLR